MSLKDLPADHPVNVVHALSLRDVSRYFENPPDDCYTGDLKFSYAFGRVKGVREEYADWIPHYSGVYLVCGEEWQAQLSHKEIPLYVGQSSNVALRWSNHEKQAPIQALYAAALYVWRIPKNELLLAEKWLIDKLNPRFNNEDIWDARIHPDAHPDFKMEWSLLRLKQIGKKVRANA